jgi:hypothetical protein
VGWWFGRKSAPADARPFVPAWLQNDAAEVVGSRGVAIAGPLGGSVIDTEARSSVAQILEALRLHGLIQS